MTLPDMDTFIDARPGSRAWAKSRDWSSAFASGDAARQWEAACCVARSTTRGERWVDATALHEAAVGAFDAATQRGVHEPVAAAVLGARRALYWERLARIRLVPPVSYGEHRWRSDARAGLGRTSSLEPISEEAMGQALPHPGPRPESRTAPWLGAMLARAGWRWRPAPDEAVADSIDAVLAVGRDRAAAELRRRHPALPVAVANNLVLLLAGSRVRDGLSWPGVVWLEAHCGRRVAEADKGTAAVIDALIAQRRARPAATVNGRTQGRAPLCASSVGRPSSHHAEPVLAVAS